MATSTMIQKQNGPLIRQTKMMENRNYDYVYDKNYHLSTNTDHAKQGFRAQNGASNIKMLPIYQTMFSELRHHPRFDFHYKNYNCLPKHVSQDWPGKQNYQRESAIVQKLMTCDPNVQIPGIKYEQAQVDGGDRYKFARRPIIPFLSTIPPYVQLDNFRSQEIEQEKLKELNQPPASFTKTIAIQTDYRDGEAQTDPYTPEYVVKPGTQPELLTLITLSFGRGLPVGLAEVEMIERARAKRAWEATLPAINDPTMWQKRLRMMTEMERKEWLFREHEIEQ